MKQIIAPLIVIAVLFVAVQAHAQTEESCECPKLACDPCSVQRGLTFYTSKCGPQNGRLKSCGRPSCVALEQPTSDCPVLPTAGAVREPVVVKASDVAQSDPNADTRIVGNVKLISGSVIITHADGKTLKVESGEARVRESDTLESSKDGKALVEFDGGNRLHVHNDTSVQIKEYKDQSDPQSRKALLQLIRGKIRNQVNQKYNGKTSSYKVITTAAVAGVRGTDFVMEHTEVGKLATKVETLDGRVRLERLDEKEHRELAKGEGALYTVEIPSTGSTGEFIQNGRLSPVYKIDSESMERLERESRVDLVAKAVVKPPPVAKDSEICENPRAKFDQCAWKCVNNPAGEKSCRTDLPEVSCVRSRCNGNGKWAEETKLAPLMGKSCPAMGFQVQACDY